MKRVILLVLLLSLKVVIAQEINLENTQDNPDTGHEIELFTGYTYYSTNYSQITVLEYLDLEQNNHIFKYGLGYTFRKNRFRHQFQLSTYSVGYNYERSTGDSFGWTEQTGNVEQQWLEIGGFGGFKVMDSVRLYPCIGFSYATPIIGNNNGNYKSGASSNTYEDIDYDHPNAPAHFLDFKIGGMYNLEFKNRMGLNFYLFYSRSLIHPKLLGNDVQYGQLKTDQFMFNMSFFYFIPSK